MTIFKRLYYRLKYPGLPKKVIFKAYTNLVCDPSDLNSGNWEPIHPQEIDVGESLIVGSHETRYSNLNYMAYYDKTLPDDVKTEREIKAWLNKQEPIMEQKKNQQGTMITKYRIERYAKNSRMFKRSNNEVSCL